MVPRSNGAECRGVRTGVKDQGSGSKFGKFGLRAVVVLGEADVEEEAVDHVGRGTKAGDLGSEEVALDGELLG